MKLQPLVGIVGRIVAVKDESDTIIIETGTDRQRLRFKTLGNQFCRDTS